MSHRRIALILAVVASVLVGCASPQSQAAQTTDSATLIVEAGTAVLTEGEQTQELSAGSEATAAPGATVATASDGEATLYFLNGAIVEMEPDTTLTITQFSESTDPFVVSLDLHNGSIINRVIRILGLEDSYDIITPTGSASVRGTGFRVEVLDETRSFFSVEEGVVAG
ncbi:MAG: FecR domain-containing protein [Anaerolineae bacterium]